MIQLPLIRKSAPCSYALVDYMNTIIWRSLKSLYTVWTTVSVYINALLKVSFMERVLPCNSWVRAAKAEGATLIIGGDSPLFTMPLGALTRINLAKGGFLDG